MSNKLRRKAKFQINSAKHKATELIMSNKLSCASPPERFIKINLLRKQKCSRINNKYSYFLLYLVYVYICVLFVIARLFHIIMTSTGVLKY